MMRSPFEDEMPEWMKNAAGPEDMTEEDEIAIIESRWGYEQWAEQRKAGEEARKESTIGYGTRQTYDIADLPSGYSDTDITINMLVADTPEGRRSLELLQQQIEEVVKKWLVHSAPAGTQTGLVSVVSLP